MTGEADLSGHRVLVVEDEYYQADDVARALGRAGGEVMGPCPDEESARAVLEEQRPDAVLLDINLGSGPTFKLAETLEARGIPFVFFTGYDQATIPKEFDHVERIEKPVELRKIVRAISKVVP
jgi:two-component SAPR family response regulator